MAGQPIPIFKHPAALEDLLNTGSGVLEYFRINDEFHKKYAAYYGDAGTDLKKWLSQIQTFGDANGHRAAAQIGRRLHLAEEFEKTTGNMLLSARRIYVATWGDPSRRRSTRPRNFDPNQ